MTVHPSRARSPRSIQITLLAAANRCFLMSTSFFKVSVLYVTRNSSVRRKVWAPNAGPCAYCSLLSWQLLFTRGGPFPSLSLSVFFSLYGAGPLLQPLSSLVSAVVSMLLTCPPSLTSVAEGGGEGGWVARRSCRGMPPKTRKKKCCYQFRGSKKHDHSREASAGHYIPVSVRRL